MSDTPMSERKKEVLLTLERLGSAVYDQIERGRFPSIRMPSRSVNNIRYDQNVRQYVLGDKTAIRSSRNVRHIKPFTQLIWTAFFSHELTTKGKTSTLRDVFYSAQAYDISFKDQQESDSIITDLETVLGLAREDFNIFPEERSVCGDEVILIERNGVLRTERIGDFVDLHIEGKIVATETKAMAVSSDGRSYLDDVICALRHENDEPIYEVKLRGGYSVKLSGYHSIVVLEDYRIRRKKVIDLREGDLIPVCFNVPNKEGMAEINVAEFLLDECLHDLDGIYVIGDGDPRRFIKRGMSSKLRKSSRMIYRNIVEKGIVPLNLYKGRDELPREGYIRLKYARDKVPVRIKITDSLCRVLGYYVSEGCTIQGRAICFSFGKEGKKWADDLKGCFKECFNVELTKPTGSGMQLVYYGKTLSWLLSTLLKAGAKAPTKEVPFIVFNLPRDMKMEFLKAYLRGDGCLYESKEKGEVMLLASTVSRKLASDLCLLLAQLGIFATIKEGKPRSHEHKGWKIIRRHESYDVIIRGTWLKKLENFVRDTFGVPLIPLKSGRQQLAHCYKKSLLQPLLSLLPYEKRQRYSGKSISWLKAMEAINTIESSDPKVVFLKRLIDNKIIPMPVVSIEIKPAPSKLYDLELNPSHTFVCGLGPVVVHNSAIFGDLTIEYTVPGYEGKRLNLASHPDGVMIGPALTSAAFVKTSADKVIAIEKGGLFTRFIEEGVHKRFNAILINTAGQPPRSTRYIIRRLNQELNLPVHILTDSVAGDEPIVVRRGGEVKYLTIKEFADLVFGEEGDGSPEWCMLQGLGWETLAHDPDTNEVRWSPIVCVYRHKAAGPLLQVKLEDGREIKVTKDHSLFTLREGKVVPIATSQLTINQYIMVPFCFPSINAEFSMPSIINNNPYLPVEAFPELFQVSGFDLLQRRQKKVSYEHLRPRVKKLLAAFGELASGGLISRGILRFLTRKGYVVKSGSDYVITQSGWKAVEVLRRASTLLNGHLRPARVTEIKEILGGELVYDLAVPKGRSFIAGFGGVLCHNSDPWGMHIAMVIISGSALAAHLRELTTPDAKWIGVWATDIVKYDLPSDPLTNEDVKRLQELQRDPRYEGELWQREIKTFLKIKRKAEQEAFSRHGLTYIVDEYLPAKLKEAIEQG